VERFLDYCYKLLKLWRGDSRTRFAKLLFISGLPLIASPWWQPALEALISRYLQLNPDIFDASERALFISGWVLIALGIFLYVYRTRDSYAGELVAHINLLLAHKEIRDFRLKILRQTPDVVENTASAPILDVSVINNTRFSVMLNKMLLYVRRTGAVDREPFRYVAYHIELTHEYHVQLDPQETHKRYEVSLAQAVDPNEADRFAIVLGQKHNSQYWDVTYTIEPTLVYDHEQLLPLPSIRRVKLQRWPEEGKLRPLQAPINVPHD